MTNGIDGASKEDRKRRAEAAAVAARKASREHEESARSVQEKTERLKALRLANAEAATLATGTLPKKKTPATRAKSSRSSKTVMYTFASGAKSGLFAFARDKAGSKLPKKFGPWRLSGDLLQADQPLPHAFSRDAVERGIQEQGFQMWRIKSDPA